MDMAQDLESTEIGWGAADCGTASATMASSLRLSRSRTPAIRPFAHDEDAIRDPQDLGQLGGDHDHRAPLGGEPLDQRVDLGLGADIDAAGRLVERAGSARRQQSSGR